MLDMNARLVRLLIAIPLMLALLVTTATSVSAKPLYYGDSVPTGTTIESDIVLTGNNVTVDGNVAGDVFAIGNHIEINGNIEGSLVAVGQTIRIRGHILGTTYTASVAFELSPDAQLDRNLYYGGLSFATRKGSEIGRDLSAFSLGGTMLGQTSGNVRAVIGPYEILKLIFDALKVDLQLPGMIYDQPGTLPAPIETPTPQTTPSSNSHQNFDQEYPAAIQEISFASLVPIISDNTLEPGIKFDWDLLGKWFLLRLRSLAVLLVLGLLAIGLLPDYLVKSADFLRKRPLPSLGTGLVTTLVSLNIVLAIILLAIIIVAIGFWMLFATVWELGIFTWSAGLSLAILAITACLFIVLFASKAIAAYALGSWLLKPIFPKGTRYRIIPFIVGLIIYALLAGLPYAGWVVGVLATAFGMGGAWLYYQHLRNSKKNGGQAKTSPQKLTSRSAGKPKSTR